MKLELRCPLCGCDLVEFTRSGVFIECVKCCLRTRAENWSRLARLTRKGRMFEWLERSAKKSTPKGVLRNFVIEKARQWWRNRKRGG